MKKWAKVGLFSVAGWFLWKSLIQRRDAAIIAQRDEVFRPDIPANTNTTGLVSTDRMTAKLISEGINPQTFGTILPSGSTARLVSDLAFQTGELQPLTFQGSPISESPDAYKILYSGGDYALSFNTYGKILQGFSADTQESILGWRARGWTPNNELQALLQRHGYTW